MSELEKEFIRLSQSKDSHGKLIHLTIEEMINIVVAENKSQELLTQAIDFKQKYGKI